MAMIAKPRHRCPHVLPVTDGYAEGPARGSATAGRAVTEVVTWCPRCDWMVQVDLDWVERYAHMTIALLRRDPSTTTDAVDEAIREKARLQVQVSQMSPTPSTRPRTPITSQHGRTAA